MKHTNPTRWQREQVVMGWKYIPHTALVFATPDGTWTVTQAEKNDAPENGHTPSIARRSVEGKVVEERTGRAGPLCTKINPAFRVSARTPARGLRSIA